MSCILPPTAGERPRRLYAYWLEKQGDRRFPGRQDIDPRDFAYALGWVSLIDCLDDPPRYRYRLVSTNLTAQLGYEMTGRCTDEMPETGVRDYVEWLYGTVARSGEPRYERGSVALDGRAWTHETLALPLSQDQSRVDMLLVYRDAVAKP